MNYNQYKNKNLCNVCMLVGPTGPKGEQGIKGEKGDPGPATIQIGNVETVDNNMNAEVKNTGTPTDVILDFKLPKGIKGDKGDQGETGPRGLPGEIGRTEHINIEGIETLNAGEEAHVIDTYENWVHNLVFFIPKGDKGDAGTSIINAYGMRYSLTEKQFNLPAATDIVLTIEEQGPAFLTEYEGNSSIKVKETGVYLVNFTFSASTSDDTAITISVRANDILQPATNITNEFDANFINTINGSTIISLNKDDILTLNLRSSNNVNVSLNGSTNAMLNIVKIH